MASNDDIMHAIGNLEGKLAGINASVVELRKDVGDEKANAQPFMSGSVSRPSGSAYQGRSQA